MERYRMANITLTRIDSRLIHGQVIVKWSRIANGNRIVIVDDELEKDSFMVDIYQMAAPSGMSVEIYSTTRAAEEFKKDKMGEGKILLLFRTLAQATKAYEEGLHFESLQLGGIPQSPGKKKIISAVSLDETDVAQIMELHEQGVEIFAHIIPEEPQVKFDEIIKKFKEERRIILCQQLQQRSWRQYGIGLAEALLVIRFIQLSFHRQ